MEAKNLTQPAISLKITEGQEDSKHNIHVYTEGR